MKTVKFIALMLISACVSVAAQEMTQKEISKERREVNKLSVSELEARATKAARTEAKKLTRQGWLVAPGALPIEKQLDRSYKMQYEYDENQLPKYIMGEAISIGQNYDAAKMQALELSKLNVAAQVQTEITALIENLLANEQLNAGQAASIARTIAVSKNLISQSLGRVLPVSEFYRNSKNGNKEVLLRLAYDTKTATQSALRAVKIDLEKKGDEMHKQLDKALGFVEKKN